jgi:hypothetical protein
MTDLTIQKYSDKNIAVQGDFDTYAKDMKKFSGRWNPRLKIGPGWLVPIEYESAIRTRFGLNSTNSPKMKYRPAGRSKSTKSESKSNGHSPSPRDSRSPPHGSDYETNHSDHEDPDEQEPDPREQLEEQEPSPPKPRRRIFNRESQVRHDSPEPEEEPDDIVSLAKNMRELRARLDLIERRTAK